MLQNVRYSDQYILWEDLFIRKKYFQWQKWEQVILNYIIVQNYFLLFLLIYFEVIGQVKWNKSYYFCLQR